MVANQRREVGSQVLLGTILSRRAVDGYGEQLHNGKREAKSRTNELAPNYVRRTRSAESPGSGRRGRRAAWQRKVAYAARGARSAGGSASQEEAAPEALDGMRLRLIGETEELGHGVIAALGRVLLRVGRGGPNALRTARGLFLFSD